MRLLVLCVATAAVVTAVTSQQLAYVVPLPSSSSSCDRPDPLDSLKGEKGDAGVQGKMGPSGMQGQKGNKGERSQKVDLEDILKSLVTANENIEAIRQDNSKLKENVTKLQTENTELKGHVARLDQENSVLEGHVARLDQENSVLEGHVARLDQENSDLEGLLRSTTEALTETVTNNTGKITRLEPIRDCKDALARGLTESGVYDLYYDPSQGFGPIKVYCDQQTAGGGWTVIQRRFDESLDFYLNWANYSEGFGFVGGQHWLGLENIHHLTSNGNSTLRVEVKDFSDRETYAEYSSFSVAPSSDNYRLSVSGYSGDAADRLDYHNGQQFTTYDKDNDQNSSNCAKTYKGAWWYKNCYGSNLNGNYGSASSGSGGRFYWHKTIKQSKMMIRV